MKKVCLLLTVMAFMLGTGIRGAMAQEVTVPLTVPADLIPKLCAAPIWSGVTVVWKGVSDDRTDKSVGAQMQKGKEPINVMSDPRIEKVMDSALRDLFTTCGMKLVDKGDVGTKMTVEVKEFYAGVEKKLLTGKAVAKSMLSFMVDQGVKTTTIDVGADMESKEARKGDIKGLTKALNGLLAETLKQVATTSQMRGIR